MSTLEKYKREEKTFKTFTVRIPLELHEKLVAVQKREKMSFVETIEASIKLLLEYYEKRGGKV